MKKIVKGIGEDDFHLWRHSPVSKIVLQYFADYAATIGKEALARFISGGLLTETIQQEMRGRMLAAMDASELSFESLVEFYRNDEEEEKNATQTSEDKYR